MAAAAIRKYQRGRIKSMESWTRTCLEIFAKEKHQDEDGVSIWDSLGKTSDSAYHTKRSGVEHIYLGTK